MSPKRFFFVMIGLLSVSLIILVASGVVGNMLLKKQADKLMSLKLENRTLEEQQTALQQANKDVQKYAELQKTAKTIVPQDKDQARTVRELVSLAAESNIPVSSISFPSSSLGQTTAPSTSSSSTSKALSPTITQVKPVDGATGLYQMEITLQSDTTKPVPYSSFISFLSKLEQNRRTAQVSNISILPYTKDLNLITFTLGINVFIKP